MPKLGAYELLIGGILGLIILGLAGWAVVTIVGKMGKAGKEIIEKKIETNSKINNSLKTVSGSMPGNNDSNEDQCQYCGYCGQRFKSMLKYCPKCGKSTEA